MSPRRWKGAYHGRSMRLRGTGLARTIALLAVVGVTIGPGLALGHDGRPVPAPTLTTLATAWTLDPLPWLGMLIAAAAYLLALRRVNRAHPRSPFPRWRAACWLAGVALIGIALVSAVDAYADDLLTVHMLQHLLLALVAPPLLALGAPITLALRAASPRFRRRWLLPILHARLTRAMTFPLVAWFAFALVMWAAHFTGWYEAALENAALHDAEHLAFLAAGALFWWPVVDADPSPARLNPGMRIVYLVLQMPVHTAIGLALYFAPAVLYPHYAAVQRAWGPDPLTDQQLAGILMWGAGDVWLLIAVAGVVAAWMQADARRARRADARYST